MHSVTESRYPITFRETDARILGEHIRHHHSVVLIGMKRVGISNFLRFFLHHPQVCETYIDPDRTNTHVSVFIDLNNLVERRAFSFWMLTLKRIIDVIDATTLEDTVKADCQQLFTQAVQLRDTFFILDATQKVLALLSEHGYYTTLFFVRFDRLREIITPEFFGNIQAVKEEGRNVSFVFTSYRPLYVLAPEVFSRSSLSVFLQEQYIGPATEADMETILETFTTRYAMTLTVDEKKELLRLAAGHVQYLHLGLIAIRNRPQAASSLSIQDLLSRDEEIRFLSEELWTSLTQPEQELVREFLATPPTPEYLRTLSENEYVYHTGLLREQLLNPLFTSYVSELHAQQHAAVSKNETSPSLTIEELSRKEHALFTLLLEHEGHLVERNSIIEKVWTDEAELGVSDWAIDRLVARLRAKLRTQRSPYKIVTVITRGYKLLAPVASASAKLASQ